MSEVLADRISVHSRFARSANVERDVARPEPLEGYVVTARVLDVLGRIARTASHEEAGGAWSLTGPYGSGKSSLALLLDAVFGPATPTRESGMRLIGEASAETENAIREAHKRFGTWETGFSRGLVTAGGEPLRRTVLRALHQAYERGLGKVDSASPHVLSGAAREERSDDPRRTGPSPSSIVQIARSLAEEAPLLLVIDEFGKSLEAFRDVHEGPYLLQQLAEAGQGSGLPIFLVTLQHLSFDDYLTGSEASEWREWAKVQGRFEDGSFVESAEQLRALIGRVFEPRDAAIKGRIAHWATTHAEMMRSLGVSQLSEPKTVASCYPLHPLTAAVLPELCCRYGQHERTLFTFLTSQDPASAAPFLTTTAAPSNGVLPSLGLESVYDYFMGNGALGPLSGREASRWSEIATRLRDATGLSAPQTRMAKRIAVLNLISTTGVVRASRALLSLTDPQADALLASLEAAGIVTYRNFADEYRVWQGSDVDIGRLIEGARLRIRLRPLVKVMSALSLPAPMVAARHSAERDVLRVFRCRYADSAEDVKPVDPFSHFDGETLFIVDSTQETPCLSDHSESAKPIVAAIPQDVTRLDKAARELLAIQTSLQEPLVAEDWVARRELGERLAHARSRLESEVHTTFHTDTCRWILLDNSGGRELPIGRGSHALSHAADAAFEFTPIVGNEMLNRTRLTSQGAKARRLLISAMIKRGGEPNLGLEGFGPEVAMYRAFLQRTGIHRTTDERNRLPFGAPAVTDSLSHAWEVLLEQFGIAKTCRVNLKQVFAALLSSPIGMKEGVIPVFLTAALLAYRDEIAIYEHGTFRPLLAPEVSERMVRNPYHFDIKHFANTTGARMRVINSLARRLGTRPLFSRYRVANVVGVAGHLVSHVRDLDNFTLRTRTVSPDARAVRLAIVKAVEPDELLFDRLPESFGMPTVPADSSYYPSETVYAERLGAAMDELKGRHSKLEDELLTQLLGYVAEKTRDAVSAKATALDSKVLDPTIRAFVLALKGEAATTEREWISTIATVLSKKAPTEWTDYDLARFQHELQLQIAAFQRLVALHAQGCARRGGPFEAFRVTITRLDGQEHDRLVAVDETDRPLAEKVLEDSLTRLERGLGSHARAEKALLACLGERLLPQLNEGHSEPVTDSRSRSTRHV